MFDNYPEILTVAQLCQMLQIGKNTAYKLLQSGVIKSIRIGAIYKIPKKVVIDYVRET
jgi:excisionase family DNA binding protein